MYGLNLENEQTVYNDDYIKRFQSLADNAIGRRGVEAIRDELLVDCHLNNLNLSGRPKPTTIYW